MAAEDAFRMVQEAGTKYYGIHTTCAEATNMLAYFRTDGSEVRDKSCTHYTALDESAYETQRTLAIQALPLRTSADQEAMFEHLHEVSARVHDETVNERGFSYPFLVWVLCTNPAWTFGLPPKRTLELGTAANIVLFDPNEE